MVEKYSDHGTYQGVNWKRVTTATVEQVLTLIERATIATTIFGKTTDPKIEYRKFAQVIHPDHVDISLKTRAENAFTKLTKFYNEAVGKIPPVTPVVKIIGKWIISEPLAKGDLCDLYRSSKVADENQKGIFKIVRSPKDNDLLEQEYVSLGLLHSATIKGTETFKKYFPKVIERLEASGRNASVLSTAPESHSLADLISLFPKGFDFRHCIWMLNRTLSAFQYMHEIGIIHGAIFPEHLMFGPITHSLTIVDWCYSVTKESKKHIPAMINVHKDLYPVEVVRKLPPHTGTDIYMLFAAIKATGCTIPKRFKPLFDWALLVSPNARLGDPFVAQKRLVDLAVEEYGPAKYLKLDIPTN